MKEEKKLKKKKVWNALMRLGIDIITYHVRNERRITLNSFAIATINVCLIARSHCLD
jgi:hypothetical protein